MTRRVAKAPRDRCLCGHTRRLHDIMGCLSARCWSPLKSPRDARCKRFRAAAGKREAKR
jgi:hypothetical protein